MNPASPDKKLNEARELLNSASFAQAVPAYEKLARQFPHLARIWLEYGAAAAGAGQPDLADRAWNKALELEPRNSEFMLQIGHQYQTLRQPEKARASFEKAAAADPQGTYRDASQPVYARSVARWRAYEKHLAPILPVLEPSCRALGYA
jgi:Flp pilus assembly protein TadD